MSKLVKLAGFGLAASLLLAACGSAEETTVKVGVVGDDTTIWDSVAERAKEEGIDIELVKFTDYNTPNEALADGSVDLNSFQTIIFMNNYEETSGNDFTAIGNTVIAPLGIYSEKHESIEEIAEGQSIAIPNDVTNGGRALNLLQTAGFITLDAEASASFIPTVDDITENPYNLDIQEVDAAQTARSITDVDYSVINGGYAVDAGYSPQDDSLFLEPNDESSAQYINVIAAPADNADNETFQQIVEIYQTEETAQLIEETYNGGQVPAWSDYGYEPVN
ncbi:MetQ/NlpA family ABC transporter substrate-binding protein [Aerococcus agrisoli]|uniref:Lipoprotein n=1 Tax=Aerococcus agrisoli TaxID=2487350 RepID=A0A3N4G5V1_9LACT|nr:MetQ/NlpA family ABC transporter substrate-binding protein [Aerococcus agrisoli]RPA58209.1 MetQ/NlpA family ABC transporter substrate-binding protein [Aerococcus agrisoli]